MTSNTVSAKLDAVLEPLNAIQEDVQAALLLATRNNLPRPFLHTIAAAIHDLERTWETLSEIATVLDTDRGTPKD